MTNFRSPTDLTPAARDELIAFCAKHLKADYDPAGYADSMIEACTFDDEMAHFEIGRFHARGGNPATIAFTDDDLVWTEFDEDGERL